VTSPSSFPAEATVVAVPDLQRFVVDCLASSGVERDQGEIVAEALLASDLRGIDSHGVARLRRYVIGTRTGKIDPRRNIRVVRESPATALVDAGNGLGQPAARFAMELAMAKAETVGVGMVAVQHTNHFGIAGYYATLPLAKGLLGFATSNASPQVTPTHGAQPMFGTNPIGIGLPCGDGDDYVLDMSTSVVPRGKLERLRREGAAVEGHWAIDAEGNPITELDSLISGLIARSGLSILPLGGLGEANCGHKGFGLGLLVDLLCGPLTGSSWGRHVYGEKGADLGQWFAAVRVDCFRPLEEFQRDARQLLAEIRAAKKAPGQLRIYIPGEKEAEAEAQRSAAGIPLLPPVVADLEALGQEVGVPFESVLAGAGA
jgi:LDH2 family malate/lactate/ureidoglycolate dehydrogenase